MAHSYENRCKGQRIKDLINSAGAELIFTPSLLSRESHLWNLAGQNLKISSVLISLELQNNWMELLPTFRTTELYHKRLQDNIYLIYV